MQFEEAEIGCQLRIAQIEYFGQLDSEEKKRKKKTVDKKKKKSVAAYEAKSLVQQVRTRAIYVEQWGPREIKSKWVI